MRGVDPLEASSKQFFYDKEIVSNSVLPRSDCCVERPVLVLKIVVVRMDSPSRCTSFRSRRPLVPLGCVILCLANGLTNGSWVDPDTQHYFQTTKSMTLDDDRHFELVSFSFLVATVGFDTFSDLMM
jgi:hypothetical protein